MHDTTAALKAAGLKVTAGRLAVLDVLVDHPHSDADSVYRLVASALPTSIQSVHNILGDLHRTGLVRRIEPAGSPALYERRINDNHHHLVCTGCGAVVDVDCVVGAAPCLTPSHDHGFQIDTAEVTFWGRCAACAASSR